MLIPLSRSRHRALTRAALRSSEGFGTPRSPFPSTKNKQIGGEWGYETLDRDDPTCTRSRHVMDRGSVSLESVSGATFKESSTGKSQKQIKSAVSRQPQRRTRSLAPPGQREKTLPLGKMSEKNARWISFVFLAIMAGVPWASSTPQHGTTPTNILVSFRLCGCTFVEENVLVVATRGA